MAPLKFKSMHISGSSGSYIVMNGEVFIDGDKIEIPKGMNTSNCTAIGRDIFIGGYEFNRKTKKFKRTLRALWHYFF